MSTEKKKEQQLLEDVTAQPAVQSSYRTAGLNSRKEVENALANAEYAPGQSVTNAAADLKNWQQNRPGKYESTYQGRIEDLIGQLLERNSFQYSYAQDPLYRQYAQQYTQNARNASADAAAQAAALTGGYGSSYAASVAQQAYQQQMGALNDALPSLYRLALDTYNSEGDDVVTRIDQLNTQEQNAQAQYNAELSDYYSQLDRKGSAYNAAYEQDYGRYQDYLGRLRLEAAMLLLRQSDTTLTDAAYACGFSDPKYLNRSFQKNLGMTPRQWLLENRPDPSCAPSAEDPRTAQRILTPGECRTLLDALEIP